jgi:hypothetical protein
MTEAEQSEEIRLLAHETGMSVDDLQTLARLGIRGAYLLRHRMHVLGIDPRLFSSVGPALFRELQKSCSKCLHHGPCVKELLRAAAGPTSPDWHDYCPNAAFLNALCAVENCYHKNTVYDNPPEGVVDQRKRARSNA